MKFEQKFIDSNRFFFGLSVKICGSLACTLAFPNGIAGSWHLYLFGLINTWNIFICIKVECANRMEWVPDSFLMWWCWFFVRVNCFELNCLPIQMWLWWADCAWDEGKGDTYEIYNRMPVFRHIKCLCVYKAINYVHNCFNLVDTMFNELQH